ncbi:MAG TPA: helix-turn-helix transcriptional regulator [Verrucomicrobiae bacterium]|nr:helix-turn-helix transcriptional regulator [Verrucomicrobiae bacterium]
MKLNGSYELHLTVRETSLPAGAEWSPQFPNWLMIQIEAGTGYWIHTRQNLKLERGTVLVLSPDSDGLILASQVGSLSVCFFGIDPMRLMGLMTMAEQTFFRAAARQQEFSARVLAPEEPLALKLQEAFRDRRQVGSLLRLQLLQIFMAAFGDELSREPADLQPVVDAKQRLSEFLKTTQTSQLINMTFSQLVEISRCTPRHLSRIFRDIVGMSFRDKQAELRLTLACELLVTTEFKIVDVALESGFQSLSLFNLMFGRRYGISPGRWRQKQRESRLTVARIPRRPVLLASAV